QLAFAGLTATLVGVSAHVAAGDSGYYPDDGYDYAAVTAVIPVYNDVQVVEPRTQCWDQTVTYQQPSPAGAIIGGLIGLPSGAMPRVAIAMAGAATATTIAVTKAPAW